MTLVYVVMYFLPSLAGWLLSQATTAELPLRRIFLMNLLVGWTGFGWVFCWIWLVVKLVPARAAQSGGGGHGPGTATGTTNTPPPTSDTPRSYEPPERKPCGSCGGTGRTTCWSCGGQGGQWRQPVTATDTASWVACGGCTSSGKVTCSSCNGSGSEFLFTGWPVEPHSRRPEVPAPRRQHLLRAHEVTKDDVHLVQGCRQPSRNVLRLPDAAAPKNPLDTSTQPPSPKRPSHSAPSFAGALVADYGGRGGRNHADDEEEAQQLEP